MSAVTSPRPLRAGDPMIHFPQEVGDLPPGFQVIGHRKHVCAATALCLEAAGRRALEFAIGPPNRRGEYPVLARRLDLQST